MAASFNDSAILAADTLFQGRVREALVATCFNISSESPSTPSHYARVHLVVQILTSIEISSGNMPVWVLRFTPGIATDASVLADATVAGTVVLTAVNIDAQQALVTDAHITNAISSQFNAYLYPA
jgi:hypothetical protein